MAAMARAQQRRGPWATLEDDDDDGEDNNDGDEQDDDDDGPDDYDDCYYLRKLFEGRRQCGGDG